MLAAIVAFLKDIPIISSTIKSILAAFSKSPQQKAEQVASDANADQNNIDKTGRPL